MKPFAAVALAALSITGAATAETRFTTIYSFAGGFPTGLIISGGTIYGAADQGACGNFFQLQPPAAPGEQWSETVLHAFAGALRPYRGRGTKRLRHGVPTPASRISGRPMDGNSSVQLQCDK
jgi:hypothetical protein